MKNLNDIKPLLDSHFFDYIQNELRKQSIKYFLDFAVVEETPFKNVYVSSVEGVVYCFQLNEDTHSYHTFTFSSHDMEAIQRMAELIDLPF